MHSLPLENDQLHGRGAAKRRAYVVCKIRAGIHRIERMCELAAACQNTDYQKHTKANSRDMCEGWRWRVVFKTSEDEDLFCLWSQNKSVVS